jgi:hypothetical protein
MSVEQTSVLQNSAAERQISWPLLQMVLALHFDGLSG